MKNRNKLNSFLAFTVGLAGTLFLLSSCAENRGSATSENGENEHLNNRNDANDTILIVENEDDGQFLMKAAEMQMEEIRLGQLAQQKGSSDHVKELGKMMETDHTATLAELKTLAQTNSISIPNTETDNSRDAYEDLNEKDGVDFGKAYSKLMIEHHEDAIDLFEEASEDAENQQIRTWATGKLAGLRTHLQHAEACKEACDKM